MKSVALLAGSFRHMAMGAAMNAFAGYSVANWVAST